MVVDEGLKGGARAVGTGLSQGEPASGLAPTGVDPSREWPEVEWEECYPTAEDDDFAAWDGLPLDFNEAAKFLLRELPRAADNCCAWGTVQDAYAFDDMDRPCKLIKFSTGGWSGAESLIGFIGSRFDTKHFMLSWRRGGHYEFEIPEQFYAPRDRDRSGEAGQTAKQAGPKARARAEGIAQDQVPSTTNGEG